jgi:hypothetical protein
LFFRNIFSGGRFQETTSAANEEKLIVRAAFPQKLVRIENGIQANCFAMSTHRGGRKEGEKANRLKPRGFQQKGKTVIKGDAPLFLRNEAGTRSFCTARIVPRGQLEVPYAAPVPTRMEKSRPL